MKFLSSLLLISALLFSYFSANAQLITGVWKGKINGKKAEVKIIKNGDSITGTSYYYESPNNFRRFSIKGYFNDSDNSVVWWDDELIEEKKGKRILPSPPPTPYLSNAYFNCPGGAKMFLQGNGFLKNSQQPKGEVDLQKANAPTFNDEWDFIIENYTVGANDPDLIDSIGRLAFIKPEPIEDIVVIEKVKSEKLKVENIADKNVEDEKPEKKETEIVAAPPSKNIFTPAIKKEPAIKPMPEISEKPIQPAGVIPAISIDKKFASRDKVITKEVNVIGDSIEMHFYDNAEVDGDSISIFMNGKLLFEHIRLTEKAYTIKLAVAELEVSNDLIMVAENLGSIPPNTAYMLFFVDGNRYEARLESTEQTSAGVRFIRKIIPTSSAGVDATKDD